MTFYITLIGPTNAGKTSLANCLATASFSAGQTPTIGAEFFQVDEGIKVCDTAGHPTYRSFASTVLQVTPSHAAAIVIGMNQLTFNSHEAILAELTSLIENNLQQFKEKMLIITKSDLATDDKPIQDKIDYLKEKLNIEKTFICSALANTGIQNLKDYLRGLSLTLTSPQTVRHKTLTFDKTYPLKKTPSKKISDDFDDLIESITVKAENTPAPQKNYLMQFADGVAQLQTLINADRWSSKKVKRNLFNELSALSAKIDDKHFSLTDIQQFEKNTAKYLKNRKWRVVLGAIIGALIGLVIGLAIGIAIMPAAPVTAILGALKGMAIGTTLAGGVAGAHVGFWSTQNNLAFNDKALTQITNAVNLLPQKKAS